MNSFRLGVNARIEQLSIKDNPFKDKNSDDYRSWVSGFLSEDNSPEEILNAFFAVRRFMARKNNS